METVNTNKSKVVTRSYSSDEEVIASSFPRSSFSVGYHNSFDGIIGRIIPAAVFDVLPKTQFEGVNAGAITLERMVTPTMPDTSMHSYNFHCTYRAVDRDYIETAAPSKLNNFSNSLHFPVFSADKLFVALFRYITSRYQDAVGEVTTDKYLDWVKIFQRNYSTEAAAKTIFESLFTNAASPAQVAAILPSECLNFWRGIYLAPLAYDFDQYFNSFPVGTANPYTDVLNRLSHTLARFMEYALGYGSLMDFYGYLVADISALRSKKSTTTSAFESDVRESFYAQGMAIGGYDGSKLLQQNEYALRIHAAIWIEYFRQPMLQPLNNYLRYNRWDSTSILGGSVSNYKLFMPKAQEAMLLLFMRPAPFGEDRVSTAHIDDVCRNVYAPIINSSTTNIYGTVAVGADNGASSLTGGSNQTALHAGLNVLSIGYKDAQTGGSTVVNCPVPSMIGNFLTNVDGSNANKAGLMLDLQTLSATEKLSRELKRRMWFGDSYFDVVRADYDCDISDADVLRPHILGNGATSIVGASQQIANTDGTGTDSKRGTRTAVAGGNMPNDPYTGFSQESGLVINLVYMSMRVSYNPMRDFNAVRSYADMIRPIYAGTNESVMHKYSVNRHANNALCGYGFEPYGNYLRTNLDRAHGKFLREYKDYIALRAPKEVALNGEFLTMVQLPLGHFADTIMLDGQFYVHATHDFFATHSLPAPVEII